MKVLRWMTVSKHTQGLKLPTIQSQKELNGLVFPTKNILIVKQHCRRESQIILPMYRIITAGLPISLVSELLNCHTCRVPSNQLVYVNLRRFSPTVIGRYFWNSLPQAIRENTGSKIV